MTGWVLNRDPLDELSKCFKLFDDDETGKISVIFIFIIKFIINILFYRTEHGNDKLKRRKRRELTLEQKQEIKEAFELFDTDKDKKINYHELKVIIFYLV